MKGVPGKPPLAPQSPWDLDKESLGDQRADGVVSALRVAEKLVCAAAKPTAPGEGRMVGEELRERSKEVATHPEARALLRCPVGLGLSLRAANLYT